MKVMAELVVGEHPGLAVERADVDDVGPGAPRQHRELQALAVGQLERRGFVSHDDL
jgi:hypothetical protein